MGLLSVSVDFDEVESYAAIHGISLPSNQPKHCVYQRALPRVMEFLDELDLPATHFVVGKHVAEAQVVSGFKELLSRGHEIGNHTMTHPYELTFRPESDMRREIQDASDTIEQHLGVRPVGFRSPGYNTSSPLIDLVTHLGFSYDSSVFPCPLYYSAKAASLVAKSFSGHRSEAQMGDPRILKAPTTPYRIGEEGVWTRGRGLKELPITVVTRARLPFIGTTLTLMGKAAATLLARRARKLSFVNLELHGMDFIDMDGDGVSFLRGSQPDLRVPLNYRRETLRSVIRTLLDAHLEPVTLAEAASRVLA